MIVYALINKDVIPFVCAGKGVTKEYICEFTKLKRNSVDKWLDINDSTLPTISQAKKLAKCLHIPFAGLYMNKEDISIKSIPSIRNYRTLDGTFFTDDSCLNIAIVDVLLERDFLINESSELGIPLASFSAPACSTEDPTRWAKVIREHFSIDTKEQYKCSSPRQLYLYLRDKFEEKGIFVQCFTDVPVDVVRAFSIYEQNLPIIGINDNDRPPAKAFSLIHELVHLIKRESSVCNIMFNGQASQREEVFCNAVAGELLVPKDALTKELNDEKHKKPYTIDDICAIANKFSVSREVIIRRLLDNGQINSVEYEQYSNEFRREIEQEREEIRLKRKAGIKTKFVKSVSRETIDRTSPTICKLLFYGYSEEIYSKRELAQHLGVAQKHVDKIILEVSRWNK